MDQLFLSSLWPISVLVTTALVVTLGLLLRTFVHRTVEQSTLKHAHDVSATVYLNVGVLYGVVLGLVTVNSLERHINLHDAIESEAAVLLHIGRIADLFPDEHKTTIKSVVRGYIYHVQQHEWADNVRFHTHFDGQLKSLWSNLVEVINRNQNKQNEEVMLLEQLSDLQEARMRRIGLMREKVSSLLWTILIGGGMLMIFFLVWFDPSSSILHSILFATVTLAIVAILVLLLAFDHPAVGPLGVDTVPYQAILSSL